MKKGIVKKLIALTLVLGTVVASGCGKEDESDKVVKIGFTGVIYEKMWESVKEELQKEGVELEFVQFSDFALPNNALDAGDIDMNSFQHNAYFKSDTEKNGYKLASLGDTFISPLNIYSNQIKSLEELKDGDIVAIPDDVTNGGRALLLLQEAGLIKLDEASLPNPLVSNIIEYKKNIVVKEVGAANIPAMLPDVAAAVITGSYALDYKLDPDTALFKEENFQDNSYTFVLAVREEDKDSELYNRILDLFKSEETKRILKEELNGCFTPTW